jgi:hypothetical protein
MYRRLATADGQRFGAPKDGAAMTYENRHVDKTASVGTAFFIQNKLDDCPFPLKMHFILSNEPPFYKHQESFFSVISDIPSFYSELEGTLWSGFQRHTECVATAFSLPKNNPRVDFFNHEIPFSPTLASL